MNRIKSLGGYALIVILAILFTNVPRINEASAQNGAGDDMQKLITRLVSKANDAPGLIIFIKFANPLINDELVWGIGDPGDKLERHIVEIGKDYLCFREIAGGADSRRCTPFSNIVSITYLNN